MERVVEIPYPHASLYAIIASSSKKKMKMELEGNKSLTLRVVSAISSLKSQPKITDYLVSTQLDLLIYLFLQ